MIRSTVLSALLVSTCALSASTSAKHPVVWAGGEITIEAGDYPLEALVARASETLKLNFIISDEAKQNLSQRLRWTATQSYSRSEFRRLFERMLTDRYFALDPLQGVEGNEFRLIDLRGNPMAKASLTASAAVITPDQADALEGRAIIVTTTFSLKYQDAQRIQSSLRQYLGDTQLERVFNLGSSTLLVTSNPSVVVAIGKFLKTVDVAPTDFEEQVRTSEALTKKLMAIEKRVDALELRAK